jgi:hypothetical protein
MHLFLLHRVVFVNTDADFFTAVREASTYPRISMRALAPANYARHFSTDSLPLKIIYPRRKNRPDNAPASIHEGRFMRRLVVRIGGGGRARVQHAHPKPGG